LLPSVNDPKLWQVRVKKGKERVAAMALMNKMIDFTKKGKPLSILSATYVENIENFCFVEAYKIESVKEAI
jgi:transcription elongation factor SPT5